MGAEKGSCTRGRSTTPPPPDAWAASSHLWPKPNQPRTRIASATIHDSHLRDIRASSPPPRLLTFPTLFSHLQFLEIPTCESDDAVQNFDLDVCAGFLDYVDAVSAGEESDPVCEPACARQWRTISSDCLSDAFDEFAGPDSNVTAPTLAYFAACTSVSIAESFHTSTVDGVEEATSPAPAPEVEAVPSIEEAVTPTAAPEAEVVTAPQSPPVFVNASGDGFSSFLNDLAVAYDNAISEIADTATTTPPTLSISDVLG